VRRLDDSVVTSHFLLYDNTAWLSVASVFEASSCSNICHRQDNFREAEVNLMYVQGRAMLVSRMFDPT
jgi:hypothetical protein